MRLERCKVVGALKRVCGKGATKVKAYGHGVADCRCSRPVGATSWRSRLLVAPHGGRWVFGGRNTGYGVPVLDRRDRLRVCHAATVWPLWGDSRRFVTAASRCDRASTTETSLGGG